MNFCKSFSFCLYLGFAGMIAHAVIASLLLLFAFAIEAITTPFMREVAMHELFPGLCIFLVLSWVISPLAICCFRKAMDIAANCEIGGCAPAMKKK